MLHIICSHYDVSLVYTHSDSASCINHTIACNQWGSKKTRQSYSCLFELNNKRTHRGHCVSCVELLTEAFDTPERTIEDYYGLFLNLSDSDDVMEECSSKKDIASQIKAQHKPQNR